MVFSVSKPSPVIVTSVPPGRAPDVGNTFVTLKLYVSWGNAPLEMKLKMVRKYDNRIYKLV